MTTPKGRKTAVKPNGIAYSYIRFSRPEQLKGNSLRRQKKASADYAAEHNLELDGRSMEDLGISGYRGKNAIEGALAGFLEGVRTGKVEPGSTLMVESFDRLSRDQITDALTQFLNIINAGITVVTLMDKMSYSRESINKNPGSLMMSIMIMARAHEESSTKGERVGDAWAKKRRDAAANKKPLTKLCPEWLELTKDGYVIQEHRAIIVRRIFDMAATDGPVKIANVLNREKIPTWSTWKTEPTDPETGETIEPATPEESRIGQLRGKGWHDSYVKKILMSRATLGEFQPHRIDKESRLRVPDGDPIEGYFPAVIKQTLWDGVYVKDGETKISIPRGPRTVRIANLFSGIVFDGYTGAVMRFVDKGHKDKPNDWRYLISDISRIEPGTKGQTWPYANFEKNILSKLRSLDWQNLTDKKPDDQTAALQIKAAELAAKVQKLQGQLNRFFSTFLDENQDESFQEDARAKAASLSEQIKSAKAEHKIAQDALSQLTTDHSAMTEGIDEFKQLIGDGDPNSRSRLQMEIRRRIKRITLFRKGGHPMLKAAEESTQQPNPTVEITFANGYSQYHVFIGMNRKEHHARQQYRDPVTHAFSKRPAAAEEESGIGNTPKRLTQRQPRDIEVIVNAITVITGPTPMQKAPRIPKNPATPSAAS